MEGMPHPAEFASEIGRKIPQLNGSDMYGVLNTPISLGIGDTLLIKFSTLQSGVSHFICDKVEFDAADLLQLTDVTATIDGVAVVDGASIADYIEGGEHELMLTATAAITVTYYGTNAALTAKWKGQIWDFGDYPMSSGSATVEYKRGESAPSANYITMYGFSIDSIDWPGYHWESSAEWDWFGSLESGSVSFDFYGTSSTPVSVSITTIGSVSQKNWRGLAVDTASAHTYPLAPDGQKISVSILSPSTVIIAAISGAQLAGNVPNFTPFTSLNTAAMDNCKLTSYPYIEGRSLIASSVTTLNLQNNSLPAADNDRILRDLKASVELSARAGTVTLTGPNMGIPTGGNANADVVWLRANGWTVNINT